jgi:hypothetical protein
MSRFGSRRHKLSLVAAFGALIAALVGFLLIPDGDQRDSVQIQLRLVTTNNAEDAIVWFCVTNSEKKTVIIFPEYSGLEAEESWLELPAPAFGPKFLKLGAGQGQEIPISIPQDGRLWRGKVLSLVKPTDFNQARWELREKAGPLLPILKPDQQAVWNSHVRTNYSAELKR